MRIKLILFKTRTIVAILNNNNNNIYIKTNYKSLIFHDYVLKRRDTSLSLNLKR